MKITKGIANQIATHLARRIFFFNEEGDAAQLQYTRRIGKVLVGAELDIAPPLPIAVVPVTSIGEAGSGLPLGKE
jgi:hypothetical protein